MNNLRIVSARANDMRYSLFISRHYDVADYLSDRHLRFAVVDLEKSKDYPANFVCLLPVRLHANNSGDSVFEKLFGADRFEVAEKLLKDALNSETDADVKSAIEKRIGLLSPKSEHERTCVSCGKPFKMKSKMLRQRFCEDCLKTKFGSRE